MGINIPENDMNFQETAMDAMNRMATDVEECVMCSSEEIEESYKSGQCKNICRECGYKWLDDQ